MRCACARRCARSGGCAPATTCSRARCAGCALPRAVGARCARLRPRAPLRTRAPARSRARACACRFVQRAGLRACACRSRVRAAPRLLGVRARLRTTHVAHAHARTHVCARVLRAFSFLRHFGVIAQLAHRPRWWTAVRACLPATAPRHEDLRPTCRAFAAPVRSTAFCSPMSWMRIRFPL